MLDPQLESGLNTKRKPQANQHLISNLTNIQLHERHGGAMLESLSNISANEMSALTVNAKFMKISTHEKLVVYCEGW